MSLECHPFIQPFQVELGLYASYGVVNTFVWIDLNNLPESIKKKMYIVHCSGIPEYVETETSEGNKMKIKVTHLKQPQTEETVLLHS